MMLRLQSWHMPSPVEEPDANERFVRFKGAQYLSRVLEKYHCLNEPALRFSGWLLGDGLQGLTMTVLGKLKDVHWQLAYEEIYGEEEGAADLEELPGILLKVMSRQQGPMLLHLERLLLKQLRRIVNGRAHQGKSDLEANFKRAAEIFGLSTVELEVSFFFYLLAVWQPFEEYFEYYLGCTGVSGRKYLLAALSLTQKEMNQALRGRLLTLGYLEEISPTITIDHDFLPLFSETLADGIKSKFFRRVRPSALPLSSFPLDRTILDHLLRILGKKPDSPTNVLLYGAAGTGKTSFSNSLVKKLGVPAYEIMRSSDLSTKTQRSAITSCLNLTNSGQGSVIIVDEADNLLNTMGWPFFNPEGHDKSWLNQTLETPGARMIWICNQVEGMDESVRRRFAFSLCFKPFGREQRERAWRSVLRRRGAVRKLKSKDIQALAQEYRVSTGAIDLAVLKALEIDDATGDDFLASVKIALSAHLTLNNDGARPKVKDSLPDGYSIDVLNADVDLKTLLAQARAFDQRLRSGAEWPRNFNILLHGVSGGGKSAFARYLAYQLDRQVLVKRSSDILGPFVGESERRLAGAFEEAEREEAVLVIDEVDSLLGTRDRARRSWEVSLINEFLASLESYRGTMVATTNRLSDLDPASLRRFAWKVKMGCLNEEARIALYKSILAPLVGQPPGVVEVKALRALHGLTLGDFSVVRDRMKLCFEPKPTHSSCLDALASELKAKIGAMGKAEIGFL